MTMAPLATTAKGAVKGPVGIGTVTVQYGIRLRVDTMSTGDRGILKNPQSIARLGGLLIQINTSTGIYPAFHRAKKGPVAFDDPRSIRGWAIRRSGLEFSFSWFRRNFKRGDTFLKRPSPSMLSVQPSSDETMTQQSSAQTGSWSANFVPVILSFNHAVIKAVKIEPWNELGMFMDDPQSQHRFPNDSCGVWTNFVDITLVMGGTEAITSSEVIKRGDIT
ncbi:hypothetical protein B0H14DRAFT_2640591 [Mycena olivaceomarginata]|nr:hypothetical protein B0H14DRAFT_2640591 [Mycena olivaceomarginata]